jgi:hypothetical protein
VLFWRAGGILPTQFADDKSLAYFLAVLGTLTLAYLLSSLGTTMLETLEGRHLPAFLESRFYAGQYRAISELNRRIADCTEQVMKLKLAADPPPEMPKIVSWRDRLSGASKKGQATKQCRYPCSSKQAPRGHVYRALRGLESRRARGEPITHADIEDVMGNEAESGMLKELAANDETHESDAGRALKADRQLLLHLIAYARDRQKHELLLLQNLKQFSYHCCPN